MAQTILTISQINEYLRGKFESDTLLNQVAVKGEISNYKVYPSGHHYFTLKDQGASLKCVMFRGNAMKLRFRPDNGAQVIAMGKISVYPRDGAYQLYCTAMALDGIGDLYAAFEQLKTKLAAQGLFDPAHKKKLPQYPKTIGIVTSAAGAALHDMLRILNKRYPLIKVLLFPARVQGAEAPGEIAAAIDYADHHKLVDLLIVGRGGGSIEDLWAFNDETVAKAIYRCKTPIISAVGHEPDITISDYVADLRAATPSNGAELAVPDQDALRQMLDSNLANMISLMQTKLQSAQKHLRMLSSSPSLQNPTSYMDGRRKTLEHMQTRLLSLQERKIALSRQRFLSSTAKLDAMNPLKVLMRGYAMALDADNVIVRSVDQVKVNDPISIKVSDGSIFATVTDTREDMKYEQYTSIL